MVLGLRFFHEFLLLPYGLAIVFLTLIVRGCMFPITRKQAKGAKKMKELQPELTKLKEKYGKEPEKFWQAQRDLFRKHNYHRWPDACRCSCRCQSFSACIALSTWRSICGWCRFCGLRTWRRRMLCLNCRSFVPLLGWTEFNILPFVTITLWIVQQKMFMPPAATEEARCSRR